MKKILSLILSVVVAFSSMFISFAHGGKTDASGGHRDNKNKSGLGYYHYHCGGTPAHLHTNGVCPYTGGNISAISGTQSKTSSKSSNQTSTQTTQSKTTNRNTNAEPHKRIIVTAEKTDIYKEASKSPDTLATAKKGYTFTPTGSTKSFWKFEFKKKNDSTVYTGYILKADTKEE